MSKIVSQQEIELSQLVSSRLNVRRKAGKEDVTELANSIETHGIIEPIVVRKKGAKFEVIAGNLRVRASREAGLKKIPAIVKQMTDEEARTESLIENIQRHSLDSEDEADAFADLFRVFKSGKVVAERVGCSERRVNDALKVKGLIETLKSRAGPSKAERIIESAPRKKVLADVARVAETVYKNKPDQAVKLAQEVVELPRADAKRVLDQVRVYPEKPIKRIKEEVLYSPQSISLGVQFGSRLVKAIDKACTAHHSSREEIVQLAVEAWLRDEGYL